MPTINEIDTSNRVGRTMRTAESKSVRCVSGHNLYDYIRNSTVNSELQFIFSKKGEDATTERTEGISYANGPKQNTSKNTNMQLYYSWNSNEPGQLGRYSYQIKGWAAEESGFDFWQGKEIFIFSITSRLALVPTQPPIQRALVAVSSRGRAAGA